MKQAKCIMLLCVALTFLGGCGSSKQYVRPQIDEMPEFPGGLDVLELWLMNNTQYPEAALQAGVQGKVIVSFIVDVDGSVTDCSIFQSLSPSCDEEALRVVKSMPKWKPGMYEGQPVRVSFMLPINFQFPEKKDVLRPKRP